MPYMLPALKNNLYSKTDLSTFGQRYIDTTKSTMIPSTTQEINKKAKAKAKGIKMISTNLVGDGNTGKKSKGQDIMRGKNESKREYLNSRR
ncbi:hypothetical protein ES705_28454 [subsurface metagenome]